MIQGFIGIGSNIDREQHIRQGVAALQAVFGELSVSSVYESDPVGFTGDAFYNLVVAFHSDVDVKTIAAQLRQIEFAHGRSTDSQKFSARSLDLDLLLFGDAVINDGSLQIPRVDIARYAFVLEPLAEIAPQLRHPVLQKTYAELWAAMPKEGLRQWRCDFQF
jgi:2-amino-4-hydroxy-6-hydroxymethyldihydropteridine diphosphokinase